MLSIGTRATAAQLNPYHDPNRSPLIGHIHTYRGLSLLQ
jgi:hypothetical protein